MDDETEFNPAVYGRPHLYWRGTLQRFFPKEEEAAPIMIAFLVRHDELRLIHGRMHEIWTTEVPPSKRQTLYDSRTEVLMLYRQSLTSLYDSFECIRRLEAIEHFRASLNANESRSTRFRVARKRLNKSLGAWRHSRNKVSAHTDPEWIRETIEKRGDEIAGGVWMSTTGGCSFDICHAALMGAVRAGKQAFDKSQKSTEQISEVLASTRDAASAVTALTGPILEAYLDLVPSFPPVR